MELASPECLRELMRVYENKKPARVRRRVTAPAQYRPRMPGCKCGKCAQCIENERWERIFAEKFEDKDYYKQPLLKMTSPLESL
jgi:hypothetical protein